MGMDPVPEETIKQQKALTVPDSQEEELSVTVHKNSPLFRKGCTVNLTPENAETVKILDIS